MNTAAAETATLLKQLVQAMVTNKGAVVVNQIAREQGVAFEVHVTQNETGKLIGTNGRVARCLRVFLLCIGKENRTNYELVLEDTPHGAPARSHLGQNNHKMN